MAKKKSSKTRRNKRKNRTNPQQEASALFEEEYFDGAEVPHSASYIDRRIKVPRFGSSPSHNRSSDGNTLPLTDRNLQTLREQAGQTSRFGSVALNMDRYAREQLHAHNEGDAFSLYSPASGLFEFGELNPSLEHLSDLTSLDDVCFPDYYEDTIETSKWPDLAVLEEFVREEREDLQEDIPTDAGVNFHYPIARQVHDDGNVLPTHEESPLLQRAQEVEAVDLDLLFRVRPIPIQPWEKSNLPVPILTNRRDDAPCRFTYFREDLDGTIHSPTLLGLVAGEKTPDLKDLFLPVHYLVDPQATGTPAPEDVPAAAAANLSTANPSNIVSPSTLNVNFPPTNTNGTGAAVPAHLRKAAPSVSVSAAATTVNSVAPPHISPFWLDVLDPLEEEMKVLSKTFGLHPLTTEDVFLGETREKVEVFRQYYFICFTSFDIVYERRKQRAKEHEKKLLKLLEYQRLDASGYSDRSTSWWRNITRTLGRTDSRSSHARLSSLALSKNKNVRSGELCPLNMYMIIFQHGVITFHFNATPHPINVRRRARMLKDHLTVSTDWICYALIDDITDSFAPMIDSIEAEVYHIEDEIMRMHSGDLEELELESDLDLGEFHRDFQPKTMGADVFYRRQRSKSVVEQAPTREMLRMRKRSSKADYMSLGSNKSPRSSSTSKSTLSKIVAWKRKGDMLRRIGECRKRVMSVMRLLGSKADVIKGFSKRFSENEILIPEDELVRNTRLALRQEILMYLGDIQDHIVTMVQLLNHYEKLLARCHSNYLAQINIDMTQVNNDTNDVLGKITVLGTIVLPINVVTGLWGMNCIVPGQEHEGLTWFYGILVGITMFSVILYFYAKRVTGL